jgi:hypothetical protein
MATSATACPKKENAAKNPAEDDGDKTTGGMSKLVAAKTIKTRRSLESKINATQKLQLQVAQSNKNMDSLAEASSDGGGTKAGDAATSARNDNRKRGRPKKSSKPPASVATPEVSTDCVGKEQGLVWSGAPDPKTCPLEGGWPEGWVKKTFKRQGGKSAGTTDSYWYSPQTQSKFRSIAEVKKFFEALEEANGDEEAAKKLFRSWTKRPAKKPKVGKNSDTQQGNSAQQDPSSGGGE